MNGRQQTNESKLEAERGDVPMAQVAHELDLHETVLRRWMAKLGVRKLQ